jgi:hypothetical protein
VRAEQGTADLVRKPIGRALLPFGLRTLLGTARQFALGQCPMVPRSGCAAAGQPVLGGVRRGDALSLVVKVARVALAPSRATRAPLRPP